MVRTLFALLVFGGLVAVLLGGCGLSQQQLDRITALSQENDALAQKQAALVEAAKRGELDPVAIAQSLAEITAQVKKNMDEVQKIKSEGGTTPAIIGAVLGMFGRSLLHGLTGIVPGGGAAGGLLQGGLSLLLGGSATAAKKEETE